MREIKFRVYDHLLKVCEKALVIYFNNKEVYFIHNGVSQNRYLIDVDLMQYTGLKDRFGKDIYEGDVIEIQTPTSELKGSKVSVVFKEGAYCDSYYGWRLSQHKEHNIEIIGNIYENPELLSGAKP